MGRKKERNIILQKHPKRKSYREIGEIINRSLFTVRSVVKKFFKLHNIPRQGRPRKFSPREEWSIAKKIKINPTTTASEIAFEIGKQSHKEVNPKTIRRIFHRAGYRSRVARKKLLVKEVTRKKRVKRMII